MATTTQEQVDPFIDGERIKSITGDYFDDIDPSTGEVMARVAQGSAADVDRAVSAARNAVSRWKAIPARERGLLLHRIGVGIRVQAEELARLESRDTGKPLSQARTDVEVAARYFQFYAGIADKIYGDTIPIDEKAFAMTFREPLGVTAHIIPWNYPIQIAARTIAPALAAGNCCVLKPAEEAPLTPARLAEIAAGEGMPPGVLNVVPGLGEEAGAALAAHPNIDHLSFTGSPETGTIVMKLAAENQKPVTMELGGKSPNIVFADADLDRALPVILRSLIQNAGQTCSAGTRLVVQSGVYPQVVSRLKELMQGVRLGPGLSDPDMGPIISQRQLDRVLGYLDVARQEGAEIAVGGQRPQDGDLAGGYFVQATLLDGVTQDMRVANEEIFGPVLATIQFDDPDEAAAIANATPYGLIAAIWSNDISKALGLARTLECGQVYINSYGAGGGVELPFGGYKRSGFGREKGVEAVREFTQVKTVAVQLQ